MAINQLAGGQLIAILAKIILIDWPPANRLVYFSQNNNSQLAFGQLTVNLAKIINNQLAGGQLIGLAKVIV